MCVYKEHTDELLTFTVINNVVAQLEKNHRLKEEASLTHGEGLRSEEPLKGLEPNNESLVRSHIYECFFAP